MLHSNIEPNQYHVTLHGTKETPHRPSCKEAREPRVLPFLKWWDSSGGRQEEQVCRLHVSFLEALKFGQDVFSVRVLPQGGDVWTNLLHQNFPLVQFGHVYHFLYHIIGILVLHHRVKSTVRAVGIIAHFIDE